jgi:hypothetical protein
MNLSMAEGFLIGWAVVATVAWQLARYKHEKFKFETLQVCKAVAKGVIEFVIVDEFSVTVKQKEKSNVS